MAKPERRYWLMKSEPGCFSFADLSAAPKQTQPWDGVRNYQARNLLRDEVQRGDGVLFYHSNVKSPAIVGIAQVVRAGYPDHTARDPRSDHFDPGCTEEDPRWYMVDVRALVQLPQSLTLDALRGNPDLDGMEVLRRGSRLSVQPVTAAQWRAVLAMAGLPDPLSD
jgi:predicted RNA-binding protein with PUA-like domain